MKQRQRILESSRNFVVLEEISQVKTERLIRCSWTNRTNCSSFESTSILQLLYRYLVVDRRIFFESFL